MMLYSIPGDDGVAEASALTDELQKKKPNALVRTVRMAAEMLGCTQQDIHGIIDADLIDAVACTAPPHRFRKTPLYCMSVILPSPEHFDSLRAQLEEWKKGKAAE